MNKVGVEIWSMGSEAGYVPSTGWSTVYLMPPEDIEGAACRDSEALFWQVTECNDAERVDVANFMDAEPLRWQRGACVYTGWSGVLIVPDGMVAVQATYEDISTNNGIHRQAEILNAASLLATYEERAVTYAGLAANIKAQIAAGDA